MSAVFRHEVSSYFTNLTAYIFAAFMLLFGGIYVMYYNISYAVANFEYVLGAMSFVFLVTVPILTMRVLAEERKQKTDILLYSLPVSMAKIVIGKYLALLVVFCVPCAVLCVYPLILRLFGNVYLPQAYGAIAAFFLLGMALIAIGTFISSVTENQAVAAGVTFAILLVIYFLSTLGNYIPTTPFASLIALIAVALIIAVIVNIMTKNSTAAVIVGGVIIVGLAVAYVINTDMFDGLFSNFIDKLSLFERFNTFIDGVFDLTGVVYFISIAAVFVYLSIQSMEKRRWS